ncbi:unnamed protein product [Closterium sp. NIES-53]
MVLQILQRFGLQFSTAQPTPLAVDHRLTDPFPDEPFESSGPYAELVGCLMACFLGGSAHPYSPRTTPVALGETTGHSSVHFQHPVHWRAAVRVTQRSTQGYCFSLGSGTLSWRSTRSSSVAQSSTETEIYVAAMAAQELRWLTFLLTDLGEQPSFALPLFADNRAMILLCREP